MAEIDVGVKPDSVWYKYGNYSFIGYDNPANGAGVIDTIEVIADTKWDTNMTAGMFYGSEASWTARDYAVIGKVMDRAWGTVTGLSIEVAENDCIGIYYLNCSYGATGTGTGSCGFYAGDGFSGTNTYSPLYNRALALYGTGETASAGSKAAMPYYRNLMAGGVGRQC